MRTGQRINSRTGVKLGTRVVNKQQAINKIIGNPQQIGKSRTGAPNFPGENSGLSIPQLQNLIQQQPRCTGVAFVVGAGTNKVNNINLPGDSKLLLGIIFTPTEDVTDTFDMSINNNKVVDNGSVYLHSSDNSQSISSQYFEYIQPLSGKDSFDIEITSQAGLTGVLQFHYI